MSEYKQVYSVTQAHAIVSMFQKTGGIAVWKSINLSDPSRQWTTGLGASKPHWGAASEPYTTITDPAQIGIVTYKEVKRFHVGVRRSSNGLMLKLTDGATRRLWRELDKAGEGAIYEFDYFSQDAVILVPDEESSLQQWLDATVPMFAEKATDKE